MRRVVMRIYGGPPLDVPKENVAQTLFRVADAHGERAAALVKAPHAAGGWATHSWRDVATEVRALANGLLSLGVEKGDRVAILADTRYEWTLTDYAILAAGGVTVTIFPTLIPEQVQVLLKDSGAKIVIVDSAEQYAKVAGIADATPDVQHVVTMDAVPADAALAKRTLTLDALADAGRTFAERHPDALATRVASVTPDDLATLIYTSGTTGVPKGAMITHGNIAASVAASAQVLGVPMHVRGLGFLPLSHSYQRQSQFFLTSLAATVAFSSPQTLVDDLKSVQPEIFACVPRLYERMYDRILETVGQGSALRQRIFHAAADVARAFGRAKAAGGTPGLALRVQHAFFDKLVYAKLRDALGFSSLKMAVTGSAAIRPDLLYFYQGIGVNILEGYGLSETIAPSNVNPPGKFKPGTVGPAYPGMKQALDAEGEVLMAGPNVFVGYWQKPEENAASFVEVDGTKWFRTGDIGRFDDDGYLQIVDRKKEIEVLDTGKNVAPLPIEERLKVSPFVSEALVVASERKFVACLIQPNYDALVDWARKKGVPFDASRVIVKPDPTGAPMTYAVGEDLLGHADVRALYQSAVDETNRHFSDFERVKRFALAPHAFTIDRDELTMTLKKKRRVIKAHYAELIEGMFGGGA